MRHAQPRDLSTVRRPRKEVRPCCGRTKLSIGTCSATASVQRAGKWYCWQHDPERKPTTNEEGR